MLQYVSTPTICCHTFVSRYYYASHYIATFPTFPLQHCTTTQRNVSLCALGVFGMLVPRAPPSGAPAYGSPTPIAFRDLALSEYV